MAKASFPGRDKYYSITELAKKYEIPRMTMSRFLHRAHKRGLIELYRAPYKKTGVVLMPKSYEPVVASFSKYYHRIGLEYGRPTLEKQIKFMKLGFKKEEDDFYE